MDWLILFVAGLFETTFAFCLGKARETAGTKMYLWYAGFGLALTLSMLLLIKATQKIPIGTAYAVWTGIGAAGTVVVGILFFKEPVTFLRLFFLTTLIASIVGLKTVFKPVFVNDITPCLKSSVLRHNKRWRGNLKEKQHTG